MRRAVILPMNDASAAAEGGNMALRAVMPRLESPLVTKERLTVEMWPWTNYEWGISSSLRMALGKRMLFSL